VSYLDNLSTKGRDDLEAEWLEVGRAIAALVEQVSINHSMNFKPLLPREKITMASEILGALIGPLCRRDPKAASFCEHAALQRIEAEKPAPVIQSPSFFEIAKDITNPEQFVPAKEIEHTAEVFSLQARRSGRQMPLGGK
jgi:hypothetical protein